MKTKTTTSLEIDVLLLKKAALRYRAINHQLRLQILTLLHKNTRMPVINIYGKLRLEQSVASQHLAILRKAELVKAIREGKNIFYSVNYPKLQQLQELSKQLLTAEKK